MAEVLVVGGGVVGLGLGMMLARDAHAVTILERDAQPAPEDPEEAWDSWERKGVNQFRLPHLFLCAVPRDPRAGAARRRRRHGAGRRRALQSGAGRPGIRSPDAPRPGDGRYEMLSGRRAVVERAVAAVAEGTPGLEVRRGVAVAGLLGGAEAIAGIPHVVGVRTTEGEELRADLVIDCGGRRSALPDWVEALGGGVRRTRSTTAVSSTWAGTSVPVTVSCRWRSGPASSRTAPFPCSCSRPTTARGRSPSWPGQGIGPCSGSRTRRGGSAPCGRSPRWPTGSTATRSRTAS